MNQTLDIGFAGQHESDALFSHDKPLRQRLDRENTTENLILVCSILRNVVQS